MAIIAPTPTDVKAINGSALDDAAIAPFISAAECIANQVEACMIGKGIPDSCQTSVITFLTCHLMAASGIDNQSRVKSKEKFEGYSVEWAQAQITGQGILSTGFGANANSMSGGCLQETDKRQFQIFGFGGA